MGSFVGAHLFGYVTIIFYAMCCKEKKNELLKDLPKYIEEQRKYITEKQEKEQVVNDKLNAKILTEQCGMKFFLKYYKLLIRLPIRDIEVTENYSPEEKNERLDAGKSIITQGFSKYAAQHILDNYSDLLNDDEKNIANDILAEQ